jgi:uncharacterized membrane protein YadS
MSGNSHPVACGEGPRLSDPRAGEYRAAWFGPAVVFLALFLYVGLFPAERKGETIARIDKAEAVRKAEEERAPFKTLAWHKARAARRVSFDSPLAGMLNACMKTPGRWEDNPLQAFHVSRESADAANEKARPAAEKAKAALEAAHAAAERAEKAAGDAGFHNADLNREAEAKIADWLKARRINSDAQAATKAGPVNLFLTLSVFPAVLALVFGAGIARAGGNALRFPAGFACLFLLVILAHVLGRQSDMSRWGPGVELWAALLGMLIANTVGTPNFIKPALRVDAYVTTGIVLLGCGVPFGTIPAVAVPGLFTVCAVAPAAFACTFILGRKILKMPSAEILNAAVRADISACGSFAAIADACRLRREDPRLPAGISPLFAAVLMILMPAGIKALGMPEVPGGVWIGGAVDVTGAAAAAGVLLGGKAAQVAVIVKMIRDALIAAAALCVAACRRAGADDGGRRRISGMGILRCFPGFAPGFLFASAACSCVSASLGPDLGGALVDNGAVGTVISPLRDWCFALSFAAVGLGSDFRALRRRIGGEGKPVILYVCGRSFNLLFIPAAAYLMFQVVFPETTAKV